MSTKKKQSSSEKIYYFDNFFSISADLICIAGFDGYFKKVNPAVSKLLEYSNAELYAKPINNFIYEPDLKVTIETREQVYKNKPLLNFENRYVTKSGGIVWLSWTSMPVQSEELVYAIAKNITHKKKIEEERNLLLTNLTEINRELKVLSHKTSHDLKSPINNMLSVFNLLDFSKIDDEGTLELINILKQTSENLKETINDSIDKLTINEHINVKVEEVNIKQALSEVLLSINSLIQDSMAIIEIDFSTTEKITFNKTYMKSIFLNLISNSIKYAIPDQTPHIRITTKENNGSYELIVSDSGLGFDMNKVKDKIFGLYEKFHSNNDNEGNSSGIGLYLVYNHVVSLGGRIKVESKINEGATFIISFR
jgi:PAS domain S-box-containing protein